MGKPYQSSRNRCATYCISGRFSRFLFQQLLTSFHIFAERPSPEAPAGLEGRLPFNTAKWTLTSRRSGKGIFPVKIWEKRWSVCKSTGAAVTSYLDDDHPESVNVRHLCRMCGYCILCPQNFRCSPTKAVAMGSGGAVVRFGDSEVREPRNPRLVKEDVFLTDDASTDVGQLRRLDRPLSHPRERYHWNGGKKALLPLRSS